MLPGHPSGTEEGTASMQKGSFCTEEGLRSPGHGELLEGEEQEDTALGST